MVAEDESTKTCGVLAKTHERLYRGQKANVTEEW